MGTVIHLLSSFDITKGVIRDPAPEGVTTAQAAGLGDYTSFAAVAELNDSPAYTVRTYEDSGQQRVSLQDVELAHGPIRSRAIVSNPPTPVTF
jgi:hypothetical protein